MAFTHITSGTTVANAVTTITFPAWHHNIEIDNRSSNDMWARVDNIDPTIAGDDCYFVPALSFISVVNPLLPPEPAIGRTGTTVVKLITGTGSNFTVQSGV